MIEENKKKVNRKLYKKPKLEEISLMVEEAVLTGCKTNWGGVRGPNTIFGSHCRPFNPCSQIAS